MPYNPASDPFPSGGASAAPAPRAFAVAPSDAADLSRYASALYVGGAGDLAVLAVNDGEGSPTLFRNVPAGAILPVRVRRVLATGTTASSIVALTA